MTKHAGWSTLTTCDKPDGQMFAGKAHRGL